jgi:excisionase family DNA binding protein
VPEELLRVGEAAALLGVDPDTLRDWATQGRVAFIRTPGGHRRFRRSDLDLFITMHVQETKPSAVAS